MSAQLDRVLTLAGEKPLDGNDILNDVRNFIARFCAFPDDHCLVAVALWAAHSHMVEHFYTTPRLALLSPEAGSGKTRVLEVLDLLVPNAMFTLNASSAAVFRSLATRQLTLLFDEIDAIFSKRGRDDSHEDLRALLNAGYKRGAEIPRCVGPRHEVVNFPVFCACALAGIGSLPETILSRSLIVRMRRRAPSEKLEPFRSRQHSPAGHAIRERLEQWGAEAGEKTGKAWPKMPEGIVDRPQEVWEPLIAVADAAGGSWPEEARKACVALCRTAEDRRPSLGVRLLADLRTVFGDTFALPTQIIIERLSSEDSGLDADAPWADLYGKGINSRKLAELLNAYGVSPTKVKFGARSLQGYRREDLWDPWQRYLPSPTPAEAELPEPAEPVPAPVARNTSKVPEVPEVPPNGGTESACPRCDGDGCDWCSTQSDEHPQS